MRDRKTLPVLAVLMLVMPNSLVRADEGYNLATGYSRAIEWKSQESSASGLMFFRSSAEGLMRRVLIETPDGRHLVLTKALLVRNGMDRELLRDERTGWTVELTKRFDFKVASLGEYFAGIYDWMVPGEGREIGFTLRTSEGLEFSAAVPVAAQPAREHDEFAARLPNEVVEALAHELPESFRDALVFLEAAFESDGSDARGIIEVLSAALGIPRSGGGESWRQTTGSDLRSPDLVDADEIEFASQFPSVDPIVPLSDGALTSLVEEEQEPTSKALRPP